MLNTIWENRKLVGTVGKSKLKIQANNNEDVWRVPDQFTVSETSSGGETTVMTLSSKLAKSLEKRRTSLVVQMEKNLPAMQETWVQFLGQEDPLRRKWQPIPVFLPEESHGLSSLVGYSPRGCTESDMTEQPTLERRIFQAQEISGHKYSVS